MADWSKPALGSTYVNFVTETKARDTDLAVQFDPALVTPTNLTTGTVRWNSASNKWEKLSGSTWVELSSLYAINISGTASNVTGVVAAVKGGTGQSAYTIGDLLYASGASALAARAAVATGNVLLSGGVATPPTWGKADLAAHVSGVLPVANGGTGVATLSGLAFGNGAGVMTAASAAQIVAAIGATAVAVASNGGVTSVNGSTGAVTIAATTWASISGKPTSPNIAGNWAWSGQSSQPSWLWGSNDGTNFYVWNPSNFSVNYATTSNYSNSTAAHSHTYAPMTAFTAASLISGGTRRIRFTRADGSTYDLYCTDSSGNWL